MTDAQLRAPIEAILMVASEPVSVRRARGRPRGGYNRSGGDAARPGQRLSGSGRRASSVASSCARSREAGASTPLAPTPTSSVASSWVRLHARLSQAALEDPGSHRLPPADLTRPHRTHPWRERRWRRAHSPRPRPRGRDGCDTVRGAPIRHDGGVSCENGNDEPVGAGTLGTLLA